MKLGWNSAKFGRRFTDLLGKDRKKTSNGVKYQVTLLPRVSLHGHMDQLIADMPAANEPETKKVA